MRLVRARQAPLTSRSGERTMAATALANPGKRRRTCTESRRGPTQQTELFGNKRPGTPVWQDLPAATQAVLTSLMARLILEHAETRRAGPKAGADNDFRHYVAATPHRNARPETLGSPFVPNAAFFGEGAWCSCYIMLHQSLVPSPRPPGVHTCSISLRNRVGQQCR